MSPSRPPSSRLRRSRSSSTSCARPRRCARRSRPATSASSAARRSTTRALLAETEGPAKLAGERRLEHIEGFDFGNSPRELEGDAAAPTLILTTTNGTRLLVAAAERYERVYVGSLLNLDAVAAAARESGEDVAVLCAGVLGELALDDAYCAGRIVQAIGGEADGLGAGRDPPRARASRTRSKASAPAAARRTSGATAWRPTSTSARGRASSTSSRATSAASASQPK